MAEIRRHPSPVDPGPHQRRSVSASTRATYDRIAGGYAATNQPSTPGLVAARARFLAAIPTAGPVLDLGCGSGRDLAAFQRDGVAAIGVDLSAGMLTQARRHTGRPLLQADLSMLPLQDGSVAAVWCCAVLLHLPKAHAPWAVQELHRILQPDGVVFVALQEGTAERWQPARYDPTVLRLVSRYRAAEAAALIVGGGFAIIDQRVVLGAGHRWVQHLARRSH
jgi:ubiquinone/menaquinone biosynthesis C-methylase UbiE